MNWTAAVYEARLRTPMPDRRWKGSIYEWVTYLSTKARGAVGERLVEGWLTAEGQRVEPRTNGGHDRIINGRKVEIKFSMEAAEGSFNWLQVRTDRDYDDLLLLGVRPDGEVQCYYLPSVVSALQSEYMHSTASRAIRCPADRVPGWLKAWGGTLDQALTIIKEAA